MQLAHIVITGVRAVGREVRADYRGVAEVGLRAFPLMAGAVGFHVVPGGVVLVGAVVLHVVLILTILRHIGVALIFIQVSLVLLSGSTTQPEIPLV